MGSLQRTIDLQDVDLEVFRAYKEQLIDYLEPMETDESNCGRHHSKIGAWGGGGRAVMAG
jgi:hypothetical protein